MCSILWFGMSWEAAATLITGGMAVLAATLIGWRQTRISDRQNEILSRQFRLEELSYRASLFDRRYLVYSQVMEYLETQADHMLGIGSDPADLSDIIGHLAIGRFLFPPNLNERFRQVIREGNATQKAWDTRIKAGLPHDREDYSLENFIDSLQGLADDFSDSMALYVDLEPAKSEAQRS